MPNTNYNGAYQLSFEKPLIDLEKQIAELEQRANGQENELAAEIRELRQSYTTMLRKTYSKLTPWQVVQVARHHIVKDFCELHGDRRYGDDAAVVTGFGRIGPHKCMIVGHRKGKETKEKIACHFGCAHPEGYRKAMAKMKLAEKFGIPVVSLIDTPGAYPGIGAEERGQAEAIAYNLHQMSRLRVPVVCVVVGEGGSGGALGIGVGDRVAMLQHAWYSVISPEGCAAILWKSGDKASQAADQLHLTGEDNLKLGTVDGVIEEPLGGAHRDPQAAAESVEKWITQTLQELKKYKVSNLVEQRYEKLRKIGEVTEGAEPTGA
jgi:acetyl-CoA carboxylase carboxyl transferase subunit alpha